MVLFHIFSIQTTTLNFTRNVHFEVQNKLNNMSYNIQESFNFREIRNTEEMSMKVMSSYVSTIELIIALFTYMTIIFLTIIGNIMVIIAIFKYPPLKKVQNYFLVSLAISDILVALVVMPLHVLKFLSGGRWLLGLSMCQIFTTADILLCTSSILNLCAIALDRYWAIHMPLEYAKKRTISFVCFMITGVWILSLLISLPPLLGWNNSTEEMHLNCELSNEKLFVLYSACGSFFLPLALMIVVYVKIFINARRRIRNNRRKSALFRMSADLKQKSMKKKDSRLHLLSYVVLPHKAKDDGKMLEVIDTLNADNNVLDSLNSQLRIKEKISVAKERRAAKSISIIIFAFCLCWLPFFCTYVILPFCEICYLHQKVQQLFVWLGYINSSLNPFLYGILNVEFRRAFKKILFGKNVRNNDPN